MAGRLGDLAFAGLLLWFVADAVAPGLQPADAGEFQLVARELGIAHPPGYPLYTLCAHAFGRVVTLPPVVALLGAGDLAVRDPWLGTVPLGADRWPWAVNLFSTVLALATLAVVVATVRRLTGVRSAGIVAAASLVYAPTFQAQAFVANIRMPTALLTALVLLAGGRALGGGPVTIGGGDSIDRDPVAPGRRPVDRSLVVLAFVMGLAAGHHTSLVFLGLPVAAALAARRSGALRHGRTLAAMAAAFMLALTPLAYLPLRDRAGAVLAPGGLTTLHGLAYHALALGFRGDAFYFSDMTMWLDRLRMLGDVLVIQLGWIRLALATAGLVWLARRDRAAAALLAGTAGIVAGLTVAYRAPQTTEYLMPAYVALAVLAGAGAAPLLQWAGRWRGAEVALAVAILTAIAFAPGARGVVGAVLAATPAIEPDLVAALDCAPPGGTILTSWHFAGPLWYAARHTRPRPDVDVTYVSPAGSETPGATWLRRLREAADPAAAVILTNRPREVIDAGVPLWPVRGTPFFATAPLACGTAGAAPPPAGRATFGRGLVDLTAAAVESAADGGRVRVSLDFRATRAVTEPLSVVVQLVDARPPHAVVGQVDHTLGPDRWNDRRGVGDQLVVHAFAGMANGPADVEVGIYRTTPAGPERLAVAAPAGAAGALAGGDGGAAGASDTGADGASDARPDGGSPPRPPAARVGRVELRQAATGLPGIPFGDAMALAATRVARRGDTLVVDLTWRAGAAYRSDYTVSVQVRGDGWSTQDDGTPALGAIPTLKWLPGMRIRDRHRLALPAGLAPGAPIRVSVGVYDAFTLEPLPVTDAELVRQGQGQAVEVHAGAVGAEDG